MIQKNQRPIKTKASEYWMFGVHACISATRNPDRIVSKVLATDRTINIFSNKERERFKEVIIVQNKYFESFFPPGTVHQGIAILTKRLEPITLSEIISKKIKKEITIIALDQVQDPRNIGAIIRSAAAFNVDAIILPKNRSPLENAIMAKSAAGALEDVPILRKSNLVRTFESLKKDGFWITGLCTMGNVDLKDLPSHNRKLIVLGSEGRGLRQLTHKMCDFHAKIKISRKIESLNIAQTATIALYELNR